MYGGRWNRPPQEGDSRGYFFPDEKEPKPGIDGAYYIIMGAIMFMLFFFLFC